MKTALLSLLITCLLFSCKKSNNEVSNVRLIVTGSTANYVVLVKSEDGKTSYLDEKINVGEKTYTFTTPKDEKLSISLTSGVNTNWNLKAYRNDILVKEHSQYGASIGVFF